MIDWAEEIVEAENIRRVASKPKVEWQPIETAPRDGAMFLGLWPECVQYHDQIKVSYWSKRNDRFDDVDDSGQEHPTHWMPLPAPPPQRMEG